MDFHTVSTQNLAVSQSLTVKPIQNLYFKTHNNSLMINLHFQFTKFILLGFCVILDLLGFLNLGKAKPIIQFLFNRFFPGNVVRLQDHGPHQILRNINSVQKFRKVVCGFQRSWVVFFRNVVF